MARIVGVTSGLVAGSIKHPERKIQSVPDQPTCKYCSGLIPQRKRGHSIFTASVDEELDGACMHCCKLFGLSMRTDPFGICTGVTNLSAEDCMTRIDALREQSWGMILKCASFGTDAGQTIEIEPGDIVKIHRAGFSDASGSVREYCSHSRSKERFSIEIMIGPLPLILWPHEIAAVSFITIMQMKKAGEIEESFVAQEDDCGYFKPSDAMRREIYECFGRMTGVPRR